MPVYLVDPQTKDRLQVSMSELVDMATNGLKEMQSILNGNLHAMILYETAGVDNPRYIIFCENHPLFSMQFNSLVMCYAGPPDSRAVQNLNSFNNALKVVIAKQENLLESLLKQEVPIAAQFYSNFRPEYVSFYKVFIGSECPKCGEIVSNSALKMHIASLRCMTDTANRDLRYGGWTELLSGSDISAIRASGIQCEYRPSGFAMWAPGWVRDALNAYVESDGMAGLKLHEYLAKMNPDNEKSEYLTKVATIE